MKLELPGDHPIAEAIRLATGPSWETGARVIISIDSINRDGDIHRLFTGEIDQWSKVRNTEIIFEAELTDPAIRDRQIKAMLTWPEVPEL